MRLIAAVVPPRETQEDLAALVRAVPGGTEQLDMVATDALVIPVANFGNVDCADLEALGEALSRVAARSPSRVLCLRGGSALDEPGEDFVAIGLEGDLDGLRSLVRDIPPAVQRQGFLLDRRAFRAKMRLGSINAATTVEYLETLLECLDGYVGDPWVMQEVCLLRPTSTRRGRPSFEVVTCFPLQASESSSAVAGEARPGRLPLRR